ncbi:MAG: glycosyltransferase [Ardenticatenaceae bacterium]|nr:glycosyltransferase [Ardenticatenaceae bacterium]
MANVTPRPAALALLRADEAFALGVLPIGWETGELVVAVSRVLDQDQREQLRRRTGWDLRLLLCPDRELDGALERYYGTAPAPPRAARPLDPLLLLAALDFVSPATVHQALEQETRGGLPWMDWLQTQGYLSAPHAVALRAARHHSPHLRTVRFQGHPGLTLILPETLAIEWNVVPFYADARRLWLFTPDDHPFRDLGPLAQIVDLELRVVVVARAQWQQALARLYQTVPAQAALPRTMDEVLVEGEWLTPEEQEQGRLLAQRSGASLVVVARERGWLDEAAWRELEARRWGLLPGAAAADGNSHPADDRQPLRFADSLGRRWGIVPLFVAEDGLHVGLLRPTQRRFLTAVEAISRKPVRGHLLTQRQFERAWAQYYSRQRPLVDPVPPLSEWVVAGAYVTADQVERALAHGRAEGLRLGESLVALGALDPLDLTEVLSLQSNLPWFPLEHPPRVLAPEQRRGLALDPRVIPLLDLGGAEGPRSLLVAISDPFIPLPRPALEGQPLERSTIPVLQPLLVPAPITEAATAIAAVDDRAYAEFLRSLVQRHDLRSDQIPAFMARFSRTRQPFDLLLTQEYLRPEILYPELATFAGLPSITLEPTYRQETVLDAIGRVTRRTLVQDPVSAAAARHISLFDARRWGAIPIAQQGPRLTVAIANPLDAAVRAELSAAVAPLAVAWVVAPRDEVSAAITRTLGRKTIGTYLLEAGAISVEALSEALTLAQRVGIRLGRALLVLRHVTEPQLVAFLARQQNIPFFDLSDMTIERDVAMLLSERDARRWGALPVAADEQSVTVAMVDPLDSEALEQVEASVGKTVIPVITTELALERALEGIYEEEYTYRSTQELVFRYPEESAYQVLTRGQKIGLGALLIGSLLWLLANPVSFLITVNALTTLFYIAFSVHRFYLVYRALSHDLEVPVSQEEVAALDDRTLPFYTILIPLYREAAVLPRLARAIAALNYPLAKLDIKLLMEENDPETIRAAQGLNLPPNFEHVIVPDSIPKTKPKACNYGLIKARGEFVVIFDAEDLPEPDQLKKVLVAFRKASDNVACIQAKLNYYNRKQNLLTHWFTTEYSMWFDLFLPGLDASGVPVPLGGTSNHFRRDRLEALGAWDPFNVTEDADLGVRLYKAGYKTAMVDSTTFEEANSELHNWIRQRSRWVKGYIQTWLVHMRHPVALWRAIGLKAFLGFNLTIGGTFVAFLLNPIYWALTALWFLTEWGLIQQTFPPMIYYLGAINLYLGNFAFTYMNVAGCLRREFYDMVKYALLSPLYWSLMSIGAWKGFLQLLRRPFYWEKTIHGLYKGAPDQEKANRLNDLIRR